MDLLVLVEKIASTCEWPEELEAVKINMIMAKKFPNWIWMSVQASERAIWELPTGAIFELYIDALAGDVQRRREWKDTLMKDNRVEGKLCSRMDGLNGQFCAV